MAEYEDVLSQNVDEVKKAIRDLDDPDYTQLLLEEKEGRDRKTIKEFLQSRIDTGDEEEEDVEDVAEDIEEETSGGLFGSFTRGQLATAGVLLGVVLGLIMGIGYNQMNTGASQQEINQNVEQLFVASGVDSDNIEFVESTQRNGMPYVRVNVTQASGNQTQESSREFYVSPDGNLLFPVVQSPFLSSPINIDEAMNQIAQQRAQQTQPEENTTNSTQ